MNSNQIAASTTFQERMFERVRESLSELLTEEEARALVDRAINEALFKRTIEREYGYQARDVEKPSMFELMVVEEVKPKMGYQESQLRRCAGTWHLHNWRKEWQSEADTRAGCRDKSLNP